MRRQLNVLFVTAALLLILSLVARAQSWSGIIDPSRAVDWSQAGVPGGIPNRTIICSTLNPGATAAQINSAIASCAAGQVVFLNAGTYKLTAGITFAGKSNVTLRGAGPDQTFLVLGSGATASCMFDGAGICAAGNSGVWGGNPGTVHNWKAGYSQGTTQITLDSVAGVSVGDLIVLDQLDDSSDTGNIFICGTTACSNEGTNPGRGGNRNQQQFVRVTAITGTTVTITPGIYMPNWRSGQAPQEWDLGNIGNGVITGVGIENLSIDTTNDGSASETNVEFSGAYGCWIDNIRSLNSNRNQVWNIQSAHIQIQNNYFYGTKNAASESYGVELYTGSDHLILNNIFQKVTAPLMNGDNVGSVWAYNFSIDDYYHQTDYMMPSAWTHDAGDEMILFEGNIGAGLALDDIHGSGAMITAFRNYYTGRENSSQLNQTQAFINSANTRYTNAIGNVLGTPGYHNVYQQTSGSSANQYAIYILGCCEAEGKSGDDSRVQTTMMRWGNYDVVNNAVRWVASEVPSNLSQYANAFPSSHSLPQSFYFSSQPSWWSTMPWPAIGPDVTGGTGPGGYAYMNPAENCYASVMGGPADGSGNALTFNAGGCYGGNGVNPPQNLKSKVH